MSRVTVAQIAERIDRLEEVLDAILVGNIRMFEAQGAPVPHALTSMAAAIAGLGPALPEPLRLVPRLARVEAEVEAIHYVMRAVADEAGVPQARPRLTVVSDGEQP